jgi:hypothetical protein
MRSKWTRYCAYLRGQNFTVLSTAYQMGTVIPSRTFYESAHCLDTTQMASCSLQYGDNAPDAPTVSHAAGGEYRDLVVDFDLLQCHGLRLVGGSSSRAILHVVAGENRLHGPVSRGKTQKSFANV